MGHVIYIDILFLFNVCIDYLMLRSYGILLKKKKGRFRQIIASMLGGTGALIDAFKIPFPFFIIAFLMIKISFPGMKIVETIKSCIYFCILNLLIGGCVFYLQEQGMLGHKAWQVILAVLLVTACLEKGVSAFLERTRILKSLYSIELNLGDRSIGGIALLDTGNGLYDPYFHRPVMIGDAGVMKEIYEKAEPEKIIWIPYHSLGKKHGMLPAIKMDELVVYKEGETIHQNSVLVAVADEELSQKQQYQFILHEDLMRA